MKIKVLSSGTNRAKGLKIKKIGLRSLAVVIAGCSIGIIGYGVQNNFDKVSASDKKLDFVSGVISSPELDAKLEQFSAEESMYRKVYADSEVLPSYYNSHDQYHTYTRTKNQNTEGLCWLYAGSTALEYSLEKNNTATSISPKHIDYQFVSAKDAYRGDNDTLSQRNAFYDRWLSVGGYERAFGDGGNLFTVLLTMSNPYALVSESKFANTIKNNDSRISGINIYEDIWNLDDYEDLLTVMNDGSRAYTVKQNYSEINNLNDVNYIVTDVGRINSPIYGSSNDKTAAVNAIKKAVREYGAVEVATFWDEDNCMDFSVDNDNHFANFTVIDRSTQYTTPCSGGHAMTIVGWDDSWQYNDNDIIKTGAFILQNSWGDKYFTFEEDGTQIQYPWRFYMSYDSALDTMYFKSFESINDYDHIYSLNDYKSSSIISNDNSYIFEFSSNGNEKLEKITFNQNFYNDEEYDVYVSNTGNEDGFTKVGDFTAYMGMTKYEFDTPIKISGDFAIKLKKVNGEDIEETERGINILNAFTIDDGDEPTPTPDPEPSGDPTGEVTWVSGKDYVIGSGEDFVVKIDYPLASLTGVTMDGKSLSDKNYKTESGSTILTVYGDYLDTLEEGTHTIKLTYDGYDPVDIEFTVSEGEDIPVPDTSADSTPKKANTGGNTKEQDSNSALVTYLLPTIAIVSIAGYLTHRNRKHIRFDHK